MVRDVVGHKCLNKVVAVVVPRLHPENQFLAARLAGGSESLGVELLGQKLVLVALVAASWASQLSRSSPR